MGSGQGCGRSPRRRARRRPIWGTAPATVAPVRRSCLGSPPVGRRCPRHRPLAQVPSAPRVRRSCLGSRPLGAGVLGTAPWTVPYSHGAGLRRWFRPIRPPRKRLKAVVERGSAMRRRCHCAESLPKSRGVGIWQGDVRGPDRLPWQGILSSVARQVVARPTRARPHMSSSGNRLISARTGAAAGPGRSALRPSSTEATAPGSTAMDRHNRLRTPGRYGL